MLVSPTPPDNNLPTGVDYRWFAERFESLLGRLATLESTVSAIETAVASHEDDPTGVSREYYGTAEFAELVGKSEYTVREWCRLERINAEKADTGRGDAKNWKIPSSELNRYFDHGLLPLRYFR